MWNIISAYAVREWHVIRNAPAAFAVCLIVGVTIVELGTWAAFSWSYGSVIAQKNAIIDGQKERIDGLEAKIKEKTQPPNSPASRDPDGIYQLGVQVGSVLQPNRDESKGIATFGAIVGATKFNAERDFEYRDLVLHIKSLGTETRGSIAGQQSRAITQVTCEIVGRVPR